jgi:glycerate kinase
VKIVVAPDKFKGSLTAREFCRLATTVAASINPALEVISLPLSDGGDGFCEVMYFYGGWAWQSARVHDPLGRRITADYLVSLDGSTALIETAKSSGLTLLAEFERNCMKTSSFGLGELMLSAVGTGVKKIIVGLGGSATNDAGTGMAAALGYRFLDRYGKELVPTGENLIQIRRILPPAYHPLREMECLCISDVSNPLYGPNGAARIYAPQKGASAHEVDLLDRGLHHFAKMVEREMGISVHALSGGGAAGGLGAAGKVFLHATIRPGADFILEHTGFSGFLPRADLVVTGEGQYDSQTLNGKLPYRVASLAKEAGVAVALVAGRITDQHLERNLFSIQVDLTERSGNRQEAILHASHYLAEALHEIFSTYKSKLWTN